MIVSVFTDKSHMPNDSDLAAALGETHPFWEEIYRHLLKEYKDIHKEWGFPGPKYGWSLRVIYKKRRIIYLIPLEDAFRITFVFGDRAITVAEHGDLPESILESIRTARRYAEGTGFSLEVKSHNDVETVKKLIKIKMEN